MVSVVTGSSNACQLPASCVVVDSATLASSNRRRSKGSRANARTTRIPDSCSRMTRLMLSISRCMLRNSGSVREMIQ